MKNIMKIMIMILLIPIFSFGCAGKKSLMTSGLPNLDNQGLINKKQLNNNDYVVYKTYIDVNDGYGEREIIFELTDKNVPSRKVSPVSTTKGDKSPQWVSKLPHECSTISYCGTSFVDDCNDPTKDKDKACRKKAITIASNDLREKIPNNMTSICCDFLDDGSWVNFDWYSRTSMRFKLFYLRPKRQIQTIVFMKRPHEQGTKKITGFFEYYNNDDKKFKIGILRFDRMLDARQPKLSLDLFFVFFVNNINGYFEIDILKAKQKANPELIENMKLSVYKKMLTRDDYKNKTFYEKNYEYELEYIKGNNKLLIHELYASHVNNNLKYPRKGAIIYFYTGTRMLIPDQYGYTRVNICVLENHKNIFKHESEIGKFIYNVNYNHKSLNEIRKKIEKGKCDSIVAKADDVTDFLDNGSSWSLVK